MMKCSELCKVDSATTPKEKAKFLVDAHQIIVGGCLYAFKKPDVYLISFASCGLDGLSRLPPVRLMSSQESRVLREQQTTWIAEAKDRNGVVDYSKIPSSPVSTGTGINSQATIVSVRTRTRTGPALVISESSPLHDTSTSTQDIAPGPSSNSLLYHLPSLPNFPHRTRCCQRQIHRLLHFCLIP